MISKNTDFVIKFFFKNPCTHKFNALSKCGKSIKNYKSKKYFGKDDNFFKFKKSILSIN